MKTRLVLILSTIAALSAQYTTSKFDTLFIKASASFHNHQKYVEPARKEIISIGEDIIPFLAEKSSSRQPREYHALRDLFSKIDPRLSSRYLMDVIKLENRESFGAAVEFLGLSKYEKGLEFFETFLDSDSAWVKVAAMKGISDLKDPRAVKAAKRFKTDPDYKLRWQAAATFGKMNTEEGDRELVSMLNDPLQLVSHTALRYLDLNLKTDTLRQRLKVIERKAEPPLLDLLKKKYLQNKDAALLSENDTEVIAKDSIPALKLEDIYAGNSVLYSALKELYMDKNDFFLPVKTDKEVFLFPSVASMFVDPMLQISLPDRVNKGYADFPKIDFTDIADEFKTALTASNTEKTGIDEFVKRHYDISALFDKTWSAYSKNDSILTKVFRRSSGNEDEASENEEAATGTDDISVMIKNRLGERRYYEQSKIFYKETLKNMHPEYIIQAGMSSYANFLSLTEFVKQNSLKPFTKDTPFGKIAVGTDGDDVYEGSYFLIIDRKGNDTYRLNNKDQRFSYIIDLEGDDRYISDQFGPASAFNGISFLYDGKGDDIYDCKNFSLASSLFGFTVLLDEEGNDRYISNKHSQAAATFGYSCLWDKIGNDVYLGEMKAQAYAGVYGYSVLNDDSGNDNYTLSGNQVDVLRYSDHFMSMGQGYSFGDRDHAAGGIALLFDRQGNDNYISDIFGQGGAYWLAFGCLYDLKGNDNYISYQYSMGSGVHLAFGTLIDLEGDDSYKSKGVSIGCGHDYAGGMFFDMKGNDSYQAESLSIGAGNANAISVFFDGAGDDLYSAHLPSTLGWSDWRRDAGYISIFIDMSGKDRYSTPAGADNRKWHRGTWGVGLDFDFKIK